MQLTTYTDYALRTLIYLGSQPSGQLSNIKDIASIYGISTHHLSKIVYELGKEGYIDTVRGRNGGIKLGKEPSNINIGALVRKTEDLNLVECFDQDKNTCILAPSCHLKHVLREALHAYLAVLDHYTLADLVKNETMLLGLFKSKQ